MTRSHLAATAPAPPFLHAIPVARLDREAQDGNEVRVSPDAPARERIARFLDIVAVKAMTLSGRLYPQPGKAWEFRGQLTATVVQQCVVTLEPVRSVIDTALRRTYVPGHSLPPPDDPELDADDLDPPEGFDSVIDIGQLGVETLALSLDPWPRAEGAELPVDPDLAAMEDAERKPFASLADLKARLGRDQS